MPDGLVQPHLYSISTGMNSKPIGVFDSGIGGLTVVHALTRRLPHENIVYFGDTARVPYGPKSPQVVREYAAQDVDFLLSKNVKMVVIACNTVSAVAVDVVQKHARMPVVGVIAPGAKAAVGATRKRRVGIIGTRATVNSNAYTNAVRRRLRLPLLNLLLPSNPLARLQFRGIRPW